jgi:hypothetical protein
MYVGRFMLHVPRNTAATYPYTYIHTYMHTQPQISLTWQRNYPNLKMPSLTQTGTSSLYLGTNKYIYKAKYSCSSISLCSAEIIISFSCELTLLCMHAYICTHRDTKERLSLSLFCSIKFAVSCSCKLTLLHDVASHNSISDSS